MNSKKTIFKVKEYFFSYLFGEIRIYAGIKNHLGEKKL